MLYLIAFPATQPAGRPMYRDASQPIPPKIFFTGNAKYASIGKCVHVNLYSLGFSSGAGAGAGVELPLLAILLVRFASARTVLSNALPLLGLGALPFRRPLRRPLRWRPLPFTGWSAAAASFPKYFATMSLIRCSCVKVQ